MFGETWLDDFQRCSHNNDESKSQQKIVDEKKCPYEMNRVKALFIKKHGFV